jgi:hypothetical protein
MTSASINAVCAVPNISAFTSYIRATVESVLHLTSVFTMSGGTDVSNAIQKKLVFMVS